MLLDFSISLNEQRDTWTNGDFVTGQIKMRVDKECYIKSLMVKLKGKAETMWKLGKSYHHDAEKFFVLKQFFVRQTRDTEPPLLADWQGRPYSDFVGAGCHVYPFSIQFPEYQDLPASFKGDYGKIRYTLEAHLSRPKSLDMVDFIKIKFIPKGVLSPQLMMPQHDSEEKEMSLCTSGTVEMDVKLDKMGYCQGEEIYVETWIQNNSSRDIRPKYHLYQKHSFFDRSERRLLKKRVLKEVGDVVRPSCTQTVRRAITVPPDVGPSILQSSCRIINVEFRLRVYLDVKWAKDPQIKFPIVIMRAANQQAVSDPTESGLSVGVPTENGDAPPPPYDSYGMYETPETDL